MLVSKSFQMFFNENAAKPQFECILQAIAKQMQSDRIKVLCKYTQSDRKVFTYACT